MIRFKELDHYQATQDQDYQLLPFSFTKLTGEKYIATNLVGEYLILNRPDIEALVTKKLDTSLPLYNDLQSRHFLYDPTSTVALDLLVLKHRTKLKRLADFTGLHMFVVTLRCEHSCPYCQVSRANDDGAAELYDMSQETADRSLSLVFRSPSDHIKIEFQGGEPLLNFDLIKYIVEKAERINKEENRNLQFVIATNLAIVDEDILQYCKQHDILISTSLDGPDWLHNKNRPRPGKNSYEKTIEGINLCREILGPDRVGALMTTTEASLDCPQEIIDEYIANDFREIFLRPLSPYGFAIKTKFFRSYDVSRWLDFYFKGLDYIIQLNKDGFYFVEQYAATILTKILTPYGTGYVDLMSPAGIGIAGVVYNYDGAVYASDEGRMLAEMGEKKFHIGDVHTDDFETIFTSDALLDPLEESFTKSVPMCEDCAFEPFCGADPVYHYATQGNYVGHKPTSGFCERNMEIFRHLILRMEEDAEVRKIFRSWVRV